MQSKYIQHIKQFIVPKLSSSLHKGQCGKVGVFGGCLEYTGAPYYAAYSALRVGADLSHVFCEEKAATAIKGYCPDLIVHPLTEGLSVEDSALQVTNWFPALHVLVIGPGLGRNSKTQQVVEVVIAKARESNLPLILDGDALFLLSKKPELLLGKDNKQIILTPNVVEFKRLAVDTEGNVSSIQDLSKKFGGVTIVKKGAVDEICFEDEVLVCDIEGSTRRCGGQGDVLAGSVGAMTSWAVLAAKNRDEDLAPLLRYAAFGGCALTRLCSNAACRKFKRSTTTVDMIKEIGEVFNANFEISEF